MLKFYLWNIPGITLLVPSNSGVIYATQTGGHYCLQRRLEGIMLPLVNTYDGINQEQLLRSHFVAKWSGWCGEQEGIDAATGDFVDETLKATPFTHWLRVDRDRLAESHEAWVYVRPVEFHDMELIEFGGFTFDRGVITWPNSD